MNMTIFKLPKEKPVDVIKKYENPLNIDIHFYNVYERADTEGKTKLISAKLQSFIQECIINEMKKNKNRDLQFIKDTLNDGDALWKKFCTILNMSEKQNEVFSIAIEKAFPELFLIWKDGNLSKGKLKRS